MQVAELVVEQVLTGLLVLVAVVLPFLGLACLGNGTQLDPVLGGLFLGVGYLLGVPLEAFADHVTGSLEHRTRLDFASKRLAGSEPPKGPFPEDHWRALVLGKGEESARWLAYLRTRIRIARSLAVYVPVGVVSALLVQRGATEHHAAIAFALLAVAYLVAFGCASSQRDALPKTEKLTGGESFPLGGDWVLLWGLVSWLAPALFVLATCPEGTVAEPWARWGASVGILGVGVGLQVLSGWAWVKIQKTFQESLCKAVEVSASSS